jgi:hypothetical protein
MQIEFVNEEIELIPSDSACTVNGLYSFRNAGPDSSYNTLFYPFVVNEQLPYPDTINVIDVQSNQHKIFSRSKSGIYISVSIPAFDIALYRISYTQRTADHSMKYILLTTAQWRKPLEQAIYRVRIPKKYKLTSSTLMLPYSYEQNGEYIFEACEENYMPSTDFIIKWKRRVP